MSDREWRLIELLNAAREFLEKKGLENPRGDAEAMLGKVLGLPRVQLYVQHDRPMKPDEIAGYRALLSRRAQREPLQLLLGSIELCDAVIHVSPGLLIPRPETEELADLLIKRIREQETPGPVRVLDIGTGSGYQAAVLAELGCLVTSVEREPALALDARRRLAALGYEDRVTVTAGDGTLGMPEGAPWDGIVVAAAAPEIPEALRQQLGEGRRLVIPVGSRREQQLLVVERHGSEWLERSDGACVFVPLIGEAGWRA